MFEPNEKVDEVVQVYDEEGTDTVIYYDEEGTQHVEIKEDYYNG